MFQNGKLGDHLSLRRGTFSNEKGGMTIDIDKNWPDWVQQLCGVLNASPDFVGGKYQMHRMLRQLKGGHLPKLLLQIDSKPNLAPLKNRLVEFLDAELGK